MAIFAPNPEAIARVPRSIAFRYDVLPLSVTDGVLAVAERLGLNVIQACSILGLGLGVSLATL